MNFPPGFVPAWSCGGRHFGFECVSPLHRSIFYRSLSPASLAIVSSSFEFIDVIFPHFFFAFSCIDCPLNSHPISFLKRAHMLRARHSFFHRQRSAHLFHFRPFIFTFTSFIFFSVFSFAHQSDTLHFRRFHFQRFPSVISFSHFNISFFCFLSPTSHIPLAVLATHFHSILSFSPVQILHSIHFTLFIQFNSLSSFFFIRSPSFVIAPPSCW